MLETISIGLSLLLLAAKEAATSEIAKSAFSGIVGNRADHWVTNGFYKIKEIFNFKDKGIPENSELLKILRKSMLTATDMLYKSMKDDDQDKTFRKILKAWIEAQLNSLDKISDWVEWNNPAINELEFFFTNEKAHEIKKARLIELMTFSWKEYIAKELSIELPIGFVNKLNKGWNEKGKLITWQEATMVLVIDALKNTKDEKNQKASKAFENNFLSEIKLQLKDIQGYMLSMFPNNAIIINSSNTILSQQRTIESQQKSIENLSKTEAVVSKDNLSKVRKELTALGFRYDEYLQKANELVSANIEESKRLFMESANVLNEITQLYEWSRVYISIKNRSKLDNLLATTRSGNNAEIQFTQLIEFIQFFDKTINNELESR